MEQEKLYVIEEKTYEAHIDEEVHAHVARGVVGDGVVAQDGVARGQKQAVAGLRGFGRHLETVVLERGHV